MGRIIAIGGGFDGKDADFLVKHIITVSGKSKPSFLEIPTTAYDNFSPAHFMRFFNHGCDADVLRLTFDGVTEKLTAEKIRKADVIHVPGGNLRFVSEVWKRTGTDKYLREAYERGAVLYGESSGSMCWFSEGYDDCGPENEFMFVDALGLLPYCNCPHYESEAWQSFNGAVRSRSISAIACENEAAICFIDGERYVLHSPARPDARCWFFDANDDFRRYDLELYPEIMKKL